MKLGIQEIRKVEEGGKNGLGIHSGATAWTRC